jgi:hypothetical protein
MEERYIVTMIQVQQVETARLTKYVMHCPINTAMNFS